MWYDRAKCAGQSALFETPGQETTCIAICASCPVFDECRADCDRWEAKHRGCLAYNVVAMETTPKRIARRRAQNFRDPIVPTKILELMVAWRSRSARPETCNACGVGMVARNAHLDSKSDMRRYGGNGVCSSCYQKTKKWVQDTLADGSLGNALFDLRQQKLAENANQSPEKEPGNAFPPTGIHDKASTRPTKGRIPERTSVNEKDC